MNLLAKVLPKLFGTSELPTEHEVNWLIDSVAHSPDLGILEQFEFQLLFSPDETQRDLSAYSLIEDSAFLCHAYTARPFNYWEQRDGLPIPMETTNQVFGVPSVHGFPPALKIKGELHLIRPYQFKELDIYKENRVQFLRKRVKLLIPHHPTNKPAEEQVYVLKGAWMYVGAADYWNDLLDGGFNFKAVQTHTNPRPWLTEYYRYSNRSK